MNIGRTVIRNLPGIYWHYFSWQRTMRVTSLIGIALLLLGVAFRTHPIAGLPIMLGLVLVLLFPAAFGGGAYRELVSNRRLSLVPNLRMTATIALMLLALTGGLAAALFVRFIGRDPAFAVTVSVLVFGLISLHLQITQWLIGRPFGLLILLFAPLTLVLVTRHAGPEFQPDLSQQWPIPAVAVLWWVWLFKSTRRAVPPPRPATPRWLTSMGDQRLSNLVSHNVTSPGGTLLRGTPDSWPSRILSTLFVLGCYLGIILVVVFVMRGGTDNGLPGAVLFLIVSFFGFLSMVSARAGDWPARLRLLWLRAAGDRKSGWRLIEQSLLADTLLVCGLAGLVTLGCFKWSNVQPEHLLAYLAACIALNPLYGYLAFWSRARGWPPALPLLLIGLTALLGLLSFALMLAGDVRLPLFWLLPGATVLTLALRTLARRRVLRIDWCAVRPIKRSV